MYRHILYEWICVALCVYLVNQMDPYCPISYHKIITLMDFFHTQHQKHETLLLAIRCAIHVHTGFSKARAF